MTEILSLPENYVEFLGHTIRAPENREDYQRVMKRFLPEDDYKTVMQGVYNYIYYQHLDKRLSKIVDEFFSLPERKKNADLT